VSRQQQNSVIYSSMALVAGQGSHTKIYYNFVKACTVTLAITSSHCTQIRWKFQSASSHTKNIKFGLYLTENTWHHHTEINCLMCLAKTHSLVVMQEV